MLLQGGDPLFAIAIKAEGRVAGVPLQNEHWFPGDVEKAVLRFWNFEVGCGLIQADHLCTPGELQGGLLTEWPDIATSEEVEQVFNLLVSKLDRRYWYVCLLPNYFYRKCHIMLLMRYPVIKG